MAFKHWKRPLIRAGKGFFLKAGYTVLHGDVRRSIRENVKDEQTLPPHLLRNARVVASRYEVLPLLPRGGTAVEVGVAYGDFTRSILDILQPDHFVAIDTFGIQAGDEPWGRQSLRDGQCSHYEYYTRQFDSHIRDGKMEVKKGLSWEMLKHLPDQSIDYLYVDADHSYDSVSKEIEALRSKVKEGAIIQFNDYTHFDFDAMTAYGVPAAVHAFMRRDNYELLYLCLHPKGFYDVVLRKLARDPS